MPSYPWLKERQQQAKAEKQMAPRQFYSPGAAARFSMYTGAGENGVVEPTMPTHVIQTNRGPRTLDEGERLNVGPNGQYQVIPASAMGGQQATNQVAGRTDMRRLSEGINFGSTGQPQQLPPRSWLGGSPAYSAAGSVANPVSIGNIYSQSGSVAPGVEMTPIAKPETYSAAGSVAKPVSLGFANDQNLLPGQVGADPNTGGDPTKINPYGGFGGTPKKTYSQKALELAAATGMSPDAAERSIASGYGGPPPAEPIGVGGAVDPGVTITGLGQPNTDPNAAQGGDVAPGVTITGLGQANIDATTGKPVLPGQPLETVAGSATAGNTPSTSAMIALRRQALYGSDATSMAGRKATEDITGRQAVERAVLNQELAMKNLPEGSAAAQSARLRAQQAGELSGVETQYGIAGAQAQETAQRALPGEERTQAEFEFGMKKDKSQQEYDEFLRAAEYGDDATVNAAYEKYFGKPMTDAAMVNDLRNYARSTRAQTLESGELAIQAQKAGLTTDKFSQANALIGAGYDRDMVNAAIPGLNLTATQFESVRAYSPAGQTDFTRTQAAFNVLMASNEPKNIAQAASMFGKMFPGVSFDAAGLIEQVGQEKFAKGMEQMATLGTTFKTWEEAKASAKGLGLIETFGEQAAKEMFSGLKVNAIDEQWNTIEESKWYTDLLASDPESAKEVAGIFTAALTGELSFDITPEFTVKDASGKVVGKYATQELADAAMKGKTGYTSTATKKYVMKSMTGAQTVVNVGADGNPEPKGLDASPASYKKFQTTYGSAAKDVTQGLFAQWRTDNPYDPDTLDAYKAWKESSPLLGDVVVGDVFTRFHAGEIVPINNMSSYVGKDTGVGSVAKDKKGNPLVATGQGVAPKNYLTGGGGNYVTFSDEGGNKYMLVKDETSTTPATYVAAWDDAIGAYVEYSKFAEDIASLDLSDMDFSLFVPKVRNNASIWKENGQRGALVEDTKYEGTLTDPLNKVGLGTYRSWFYGEEAPPAATPDEIRNPHENTPDNPNT